MNEECAYDYDTNGYSPNLTWKSIKEKIRGIVFREGLQILDSLQLSASCTSPTNLTLIQEEEQFIESLRISMPSLIDSEIEWVARKFCIKKNFVNISKFTEYLAVYAPRDYVDPESMLDRLPQPYRFINKILMANILEPAMDIIGAKMNKESSNQMQIDGKTLTPTKTLDFDFVQMSPCEKHGGFIGASADGTLCCIDKNNVLCMKSSRTSDPDKALPGTFITMSKYISYSYESSSVLYFAAASNILPLVVDEDHDDGSGQSNLDTKHNDGSSTNTEYKENLNDNSSPQRVHLYETNTSNETFNLIYSIDIKTGLHVKGLVLAPDCSYLSIIYTNQRTEYYSIELKHSTDPLGIPEEDCESVGTSHSVVETLKEPILVTQDTSLKVGSNESQHSKLEKEKHDFVITTRSNQVTTVFGIKKITSENNFHSKPSQNGSYSSSICPSILSSNLLPQSKQIGLNSIVTTCAYVLQYGGMKIERYNLPNIKKKYEMEAKVSDINNTAAMGDDDKNNRSKSTAIKSQPPREWILSSPLEAFASDPSGTYLATGLYSGDVVVWDARIGTETTLPQKHRTKVTGIAFVNQSKLVTGSSDGCVHIYDLMLMKPSLQFYIDIKSRINDIQSFTNLAIPLVVVTAANKSVYIVDTDAGRVAGVLVPPSDPQEGGFKDLSMTSSANQSSSWLHPPRVTICNDNIYIFNQMGSSLSYSKNNEVLMSKSVSVYLYYLSNAIQLMYPAINNVCKKYFNDMKELPHDRIIDLLFNTTFEERFSTTYDLTPKMDVIPAPIQFNLPSTTGGASIASRSTMQNSVSKGSIASQNSIKSKTINNRTSPKSMKSNRRLSMRQSSNGNMSSRGKGIASRKNTSSVDSKPHNTVGDFTSLTSLPGTLKRPSVAYFPEFNEPSKQVEHFIKTRVENRRNRENRIASFLNNLSSQKSPC